MAVSYAYRQSVKRRKRRSRRLEVACFFVLMAMGLAEAGVPLMWRTLGMLMMPYCLVLTRVFLLWPGQRITTVTSLDDRAMAEYGVEFEQTTPAQQKDLLARYRVGTFLLGYYPDEYEEAQERESYLRAYGVLRVLLPEIAVVYWMGWCLLPEGSVRVAWTDGPVVLTWVCLLVVAMPQLLRMWTEPDDPGAAEPSLVVGAQRRLEHGAAQLVLAEDMGDVSPAQATERGRDQPGAMVEGESGDVGQDGAGLAPRQEQEPAFTALACGGPFSLDIVHPHHRLLARLESP